MINIRFHVVSIVAVFLALGVGVAMGASFIDRATVSSMQDRVDDLENGFRERGTRIGRFEEFLRSSDEAAASLTAPGSRAADGALSDLPVVLVVPRGLPDGTDALLAEVLANASADVVGRVELQESLAEGSNAEELAGALAALSAEPPQLEVEPTAPTEPGVPIEPAPPAGTDQSAPNAGSSAVEVLESLSEEGLIALDAAGRPAETAFPATTGVRYVLLIGADTSPDPQDWLVPFVEEYGQLSASSMLVAGVAQQRAAGSLRELPADDVADLPVPLSDLLDPIRTGAASNEVSTVQFATEPLARLSVVYGVQALTEGIVGHYGLGEGVDTTYPAAAQE